MAFKGARAAFLGVRNALHSTPAMKIALFGVLFIPVIFSGFYLSAFFDPYANLQNVAVAVVNDDQGATISGEKRNIGDEVCQELDKADQKFGWDYVSAREAQTGLEDGTYYMVCTVPEDFSAQIASADGDNPGEAQLQIQYNKGKNMLASQIGGTAWAKVEATLNRNVIREYWSTVFDKLKDSGYELQTAADGAGELSSGLSDAVEGAGQIAQGATDAQAGSAQVTDGLAEAQTGSAALNSGLADALQGSQDVEAGAGSVSQGAASLNAGVEELSDGASALSQGATSLAAGLKDAASGSDQVAQGAASLQEGISQYVTLVTQAVSQAAQSAQQLSAAASGANTAAVAVSDGIAAMQPMTLGDGTTVYVISEEGYQALSQAAQQASSLTGATAQGVSSLSDTLSAYAADDSQLSAGSQQLVAGADSLVAGANALQQGVAVASAGATELSSGAADLNDGADSAKEGSAALASGANALYAGTSSLTVGLASAKEGSAALAAGADALHEGSSTLTAGLQTLSEGSASLATGLVSAKSGSDELQSGLTDGAAELIANGDNAQVKSQVMSAPVTLQESDYTSVENYGSGFAPFFIGLGIWVGCIFAGFLFKPLNRRLMVSGASSAKVAFSGFMPLALYAIAQGIISVAFVQFGLQVSIANVPAYYGMAILCSLCFMAIMQFLVAAFGFPGRFLSVVLLTLQLTSAAGTFPVETAPAFFQIISPWMPMTYFVDGMRQIMAGGDLLLAAADAGMLVVFLVVFFALTCLYAHSKRTVLMTDLHPLLQL